MKVKANIKFNLNETIKRLEAITASFQASAQRLDKILEDNQAKKNEVHQRYINAFNSIQEGIAKGQISVVDV